MNQAVRKSISVLGDAKDVATWHAFPYNSVMNRPCPICKKAVEWETNPFRPFCSERCRLTDLGNWALGKYSIKTENEAEEKTEEPASPNPADAEIHNG